MSKRQVWVVEYSRSQFWIVQTVEVQRSLAFDYQRFFRKTNPELKTRVVKYVPEKP